MRVLFPDHLLFASIQIPLAFLDHSIESYRLVIWGLLILLVPICVAILYVCIMGTGPDAFWRVKLLKGQLAQANKRIEELEALLKQNDQINRAAEVENQLEN